MTKTGPNRSATVAGSPGAGPRRHSGEEVSLPGPETGTLVGWGAAPAGQEPRRETQGCGLRKGEGDPRCA